MAVNPTTDELFSSFSAEDRSFLSKIFVKHPDVGDNFVRFLSLPPEERPEAAEDALKQLKRRGWVTRQVVNPETVYEHLDSMSKIVAVELADYPKKIGLSGKEAEALAARMVEMARIHDIPEAIVTDFTPHDDISATDRLRAEKLGAKVIYEAFPKKYAIINEFTEEETPAAKIIADFDRLHALITAEKIEKEQPHLRGRILPEFLYYNLRKTETPEGWDFLLKNFPKAKQEAILQSQRSR